jgi:hypothetical protein
METPEFTVEPVHNGYHALSRELVLAVWGATEVEARERFGEAVEKLRELRSRSLPDGVNESED